MGPQMVHGAKLLTCSLALCWTTPSAFSITMSWHGLEKRSFQGLLPAGNAPETVYL